MAQLSKFFGEYKRLRLILFFLEFKSRNLLFQQVLETFFIEIRKNKTRNYVTPPFQDKKCCHDTLSNCSAAIKSREPCPIERVKKDDDTHSHTLFVF
jgi:hypothetical protein